MSNKIDYNGCVMEHLIGTIGGPDSCEDCIYFQDCYPSDRDDPSDEFSGEPDYPDIPHDDDFDLDDFDDDEHNQYLAYISSL